MTSAVSWMNGGGFFPIPGLGNLNDGLYTDFTKGSLVGERGGTWSLTRATATTSVDSSDLVVNISSGQPRWHRIGASSGVTGISVWGAHTNVILQSENHNTTWAAIAATSPTIVAANATCGVVSLDLLGDDDGVVAAEGYTQTLTYTGDAVKAISVYMKAGTSTETVIRQRDNTALADRLLVSIAWSGGVPTPTMTTGTHEGTDTLANGVYRLRFVTSSVTAANTNVLEIYPATTAALLTTRTGTVNVGGWMVQNAASVFPYVKTTTAAVTVNADVTTLGGTTLINQTEGTLWVKAAGPQQLGASRFLFMVDDGTVNERLHLERSTGNRAGYNLMDGGVGQAADTSVAAWAAGDIKKAAVRYRLNDTNLSFDGVNNTADTSCTLPTTTTFRLGYVTTTLHPNTTIAAVAYSRTGATDANLAIATTP